MLFKKLFILFFLIVLLGLEVVVKTGSVTPFLFQFIFDKNINLKKADKDTINILLLGIAGGKHEGPNLSDTIIFASLNTKESKVTLVSLPRDIWSSDIDSKVNTAYARGEAKRDGGGLILAKSVISKITGQPIDYAIVVDFSGFVNAVDLIGGLDVNVENSFDDFEYPIAGREDDPCDNKPEDLEKLATASSQLEAFPCRYEHIHFDKGITHMDGETSLKFVRSRHAKGGEGTDFSRSQRQEKVIRAFMDKVFSPKIIINPAKLIGLYSAVEQSIDTDIAQAEFDDFIKLAQKFQKAKIESVVLDYGDRENDRGGLLTHPPISSMYNFEWVLVPRIGSDNYSEIQEFIRCELTQEECIVSQIP
ncbi:MAG: LCP family protein [Candidatus Levybacteria bacterium]|nr:LCP family protein [Candidatus Levybacteria bacterium]